MTTAPMQRRDFIQVSAVGGAFVLGFRLPARTPTSSGGVDTGSLNAWIRIDPDDTITMSVSESEMGQGIMTAVSMLLAEELEADWAKVRAEHALADREKYGSQSTGGSTSIRTGHERFRQAGAAAREMLIAAAATRWDVPVPTRSTHRAHSPTARRSMDRPGCGRRCYTARRSLWAPLPRSS